MKQQQQSTNKPRAQSNWPEKPPMPVLKTIGGVGDKTAILKHNEDTQNWYFNFQTKLNEQLALMDGEIRDLTARVSALEKSAIP